MPRRPIIRLIDIVDVSQWVRNTIWVPLLLAAALSAVLPQAGWAVQGGSTASHEAPWAARLDIRTTKALYRCSGSVVAAVWVLTARHCIETRSPSGYKVSINGENYTLTRDGVRSWSGGDVALLKLIRSVVGRIPRPLPLAPSPAVLAAFANKGVTYFGFGLLRPGGRVASSVQKTPNRSFYGWPRHCQFGSGGACFEKYKRYSADHVAVLGGDSGGPWVAWESGAWVQIALERGGISEVAPSSLGPEGGPSVGAAGARAWVVSQVGGVISPRAGHILRNPTTGASWLVGTDGFRRWIPNGATFKCLTDARTRVDSRSQFDIDAVPDRVGVWASCHAAPPTPTKPTATGLKVSSAAPNQVDISFNAGWSPGRDPVTCHLFQDGAEVVSEGCGARFAKRLGNVPTGRHNYYAKVTDKTNATSDSSNVAVIDVSSAPPPPLTRVNAYDNYGGGAVGHAMCRGNPGRPESMPGGTASQSFTVPPGVASLDTAVVQTDADSSITAHGALSINGTLTATTDTAAAGDTTFTFASVPVSTGDEVTLSISFTATYGKLTTLYTVGGPLGTFTASNNCSDGAPNVSTTSTSLRAVLSGWNR